MIETLRKIFADRTPGTWHQHIWSYYDNYYRPVGPTTLFKQAELDAKFIACAGTIGDHLLAVVDAAEQVSQDRYDSSQSTIDLRNSLAALREAVGEV